MTPEQSGVTICLNCGASVTDAYCGHCGQRAQDPRLSVRDLLHELAAEHFGLDTKVARTLVTLVRRPGKLTTEFLAGRRMRYVPPLRLYLSLSVLFFLLSSLKSDTTTSSDGHTASRVVQVNTGDSSRSAAVDSAIDSIVPRRANNPIADTLHGNAVSLFFKRRLVERIGYLNAHKNEATQRISESFRHELPDALFLLVPGLALALSALYRSSKRYYVEHLVFALHFQAFSFAALTVGLLPIPALGPLIGLIILAYLFLALRNVYGGTRLATTGKLTVVVFGYGVALVLIMAIVGMIAFMFS